MMSTTEITRQITVSDFKKGGMDFQVKSINGTPIIPVTANRMKTAFTFYDGKTESDGAESNPTPDQRTGGFAPASGANSIGLLDSAQKGGHACEEVGSVCVPLTPTSTRARTPICSSTGCITTCLCAIPTRILFSCTNTKPQPPRGKPLGGFYMLPKAHEPEAGTEERQ